MSARMDRKRTLDTAVGPEEVEGELYVSREPAVVAHDAACSRWRYFGQLNGRPVWVWRAARQTSRGIVWSEWIEAVADA